MKVTSIGEVDASGLRQIRGMIDGGVLGSAWYAAETASTNTVAVREFRDPVEVRGALPRLYLTDRQTSGRGRHGRQWQSDQTSLTCSLVIDWQLRDDVRSRLLSIAVGLGIAQMLEFEFAPMKASLKWPNDVYVGGGKVAGILLESVASFDQMVIGIGLNVGNAPDLSRQELHGPLAAGRASSIAGITGRQVQRYDLLAPLITSVRSAIESLDSDVGEIVSGYRKRCTLSGKSISFEDARGRIVGHCQGIDEDGALLVRCENQTRRISSGEAHLVRIDTPHPSM